MNRLDRYKGCLLGLAVGDALGTTLEFRSPGSFEPIDDMIGGGPFGLKPGQWTDDTSMALCLAESLIECKGFDPTAIKNMEKSILDLALATGEDLSLAANVVASSINAFGLESKDAANASAGAGAK